MADPNAVIYAWLLQLHYAMHRAGAVCLTRAPRATMGGKRMKMFEGTKDELRTFTDAGEAEAFIRAAIGEGDVVGIAWSNDEHRVLAQLGQFGHLLAGSPVLDALIIGPAGAARMQLRADNLKHAAEVFGMATLLGLSVLLEEVDE